MDVLVVEALTEHARGTAALLEADGLITVERVSTGEDAIVTILRRAYDAVVLAWNLPDMVGAAVLREVRGAGVMVPIVVLSSFAPSLVMQRAFEAGANAVTPLPVEPGALTSLLHDVVRHEPPRANERVIRIGAMEVHLTLEEVWVDEQLVPLTRKEYQTVELLARRRGVVLPKEAFYAQLYAGFEKPEISIIDLFIAKARRKLAAAGAGNPIGTVWGKGYTILREEEQPVASLAPALFPASSLPLASNGAGEAGGTASEGSHSPGQAEPPLAASRRLCGAS